MANSDKIQFTKMRAAFFFGLIILLTIAFLYIIRPFFYPIFWAAVIAIMFYPHYEWLNNYLKMSALSSAVMIVLTFVTIFLPLILISALLVNESFSLYESVSQKNLAPPNVELVSNWLERGPLAPYV